LIFEKEIILKEQLAAPLLFQCSPARKLPMLARWIIEGVPVSIRVKPDFHSYPVPQ
jgi:hypothetical protein